LKAQNFFDNPLESFFEILIWRLLAMSTFHFEPKFLTKFRNQKKWFKIIFYVNTNTFKGVAAMWQTGVNLTYENN
jgi:hypothetical protein